MFSMTESVDPFLKGSHQIHTATFVIISQATFRYSQTRSTKLKGGVSTTAAHAPHSLWSEGRTSWQAHHGLLLTPLQCICLCWKQPTRNHEVGLVPVDISSCNFNTIQRIGRSYGISNCQTLDIPWQWYQSTVWCWSLVGMSGSNLEIRPLVSRIEIHLTPVRDQSNQNNRCVLWDTEPFQLLMQPSHDSFVSSLPHLAHLMAILLQHTLVPIK